ncbi:hypothetical protein ACIA49_01690 [Kribbella sp. NPDC051587]|uniref:hypothetical protein n=1 Tax=Kribbella sp. NPDC051587 TaxID=3364119 RepID=UPI0037A7CA7C
MRRDKVGGLVQQFWAAWAVVSSGSRRRLDIARCLRLANKAEKYVFQLVHADPTDCAAVRTFGDLAGCRAVITMAYPRPSYQHLAVDAARTSLWALHGAELAGGRRDVMQALLESETFDLDLGPGPGGYSDGETTLLAAADSRILLAECLIRSRHGNPDKGLTPTELRARMAQTSALSAQLELRWCQLASCRRCSADEEAGILATEAAAIYDFLIEVAPTARPSDQFRARCDAILHAVQP